MSDILRAVGCCILVTICFVQSRIELAGSVVAVSGCCHVVDLQNVQHPFCHKLASSTLKMKGSSFSQDHPSSPETFAKRFQSSLVPRQKII